MYNEPFQLIKIFWSSLFGILNIDRAARVQSFNEKPRSDAWASAGYFVFQREVLDYIDGDECVLEQKPLERLAAEGELVAYQHDGFFYAMDTYREYQILNDLWAGGQAPWRVWDRQEEPGLLHQLSEQLIHA